MRNFKKPTRQDDKGHEGLGHVCRKECRPGEVFAECAGNTERAKEDHSYQCQQRWMQKCGLLLTQGFCSFLVKNVLVQTVVFSF